MFSIFFIAVFKCYFAQVCRGGGRDGGEDLHVDLVHHGQLPWRICSHCVSLSLCNHRYNHRYNHHKKQLSGRTCSHKFESVLTSWFIGIITSIGMPWYMTILDDQSLGLKSASGHVYHVDTLSRLPIMWSVDKTITFGESETSSLPFWRARHISVQITAWGIWVSLISVSANIAWLLYIWGNQGHFCPGYM